MPLIWTGLVLLGCLLFAWWLGWGRRNTWQHWSGWTQLSPDDLDRHLRTKEEVESLVDGPQISWLGHGTLHIEWGGVRFLIDPVAGQRITVAPRLFHQPVADVQDWVDCVLLTHAHMDHLHPPTLERLQPTRLLLPAGSSRFLNRILRRRLSVIELGMDSSFPIDDLFVTAVTAAHGGWRYPWQMGLRACGYVIQRGQDSLYVAGDTAYGPHFKQIGTRYHPRWAILPIGAYSPAWFLRSRHMNPREAAEAGVDLGAEYIMPCHFGTFRLSLESIREPLPWFASESREGPYKWWLGVDDLSQL